MRHVLVSSYVWTRPDLLGPSWWASTGSMAVLKIEVKGLPTLQLADSNSLRQGQVVFAPPRRRRPRASPAAAVPAAPAAPARQPPAPNNRPFR